MARPKKEGCDYFPHDADAHDDEKIVYLESLFGDSGYAWYFKMIEALTRCEGFEMEWSPVKSAIMARKFNADNARFTAFIVAATTPEIRCFHLDNGKIYSPGLKKRLSIVVEKRQIDAEKAAARRQHAEEKAAHNSPKNGQNQVVAPTIQVIDTTTIEILPESTHSKVKDSKEDNTTTTSSLREAENENLDLPQVADPKKNHTGPAGADFLKPANASSCSEFQSMMRAFYREQTDQWGEIEEIAQEKGLTQPQIKESVQKWAEHRTRSGEIFGFHYGSMHADLRLWVRSEKEKLDRKAPSKNGTARAPANGANSLKTNHPNINPKAKQHW